jgi:uncharacterized membrane protein YfcA
MSYAGLVKPMAQVLTLVTPLYMRQCRMVYSLAFLRGAGVVFGAHLSRPLPENGLRALLCLVLLVIGLRYAGMFQRCRW